MTIKTYALIHLPTKILRRKYETATKAKSDYPEAVLVELFNEKGIRLVYIK